MAAGDELSQVLEGAAATLRDNQGKEPKEVGSRSLATGLCHSEGRSHECGSDFTESA